MGSDYYSVFPAIYMKPQPIHFTRLSFILAFCSQKKKFLHYEKDICSQKLWDKTSGRQGYLYICISSV